MNRSKLAKPSNPLCIRMGFVHYELPSHDTRTPAAGMTLYPGPAWLRKPASASPSSQHSFGLSRSAAALGTPR